MIYSEFIEELYVAELYSGQIFVENKQIIIPCINVGVSEHPLNFKTDLEFIDFSYLIFDEVISFEINNYYNTMTDILKSRFFMDTYDILKNDSYEIEIECEKISFVPVENYRISENMWVPIKTLNFEPNLIFEDVYKFVTTTLNQSI